MQRFEANDDKYNWLSENNYALRKLYRQLQFGALDAADIHQALQALSELRAAAQANANAFASSPSAQAEFNTLMQMMVEVNNALIISKTNIQLDALMAAVGDNAQDSLSLTTALSQLEQNKADFIAQFPESARTSTKLQQQAKVFEFCEGMIKLRRDMLDAIAHSENGVLNEALPIAWRERLRHLDGLANSFGFALDNTVTQTLLQRTAGLVATQHVNAKRAALLHDDLQPMVAQLTAANSAQLHIPNLLKVIADSQHAQDKLQRSPLRRQYAPPVR